MKKINLVLPALLLALSCQEDVDLQTSNDTQLVSEDNYAVYLDEQGNKVPLNNAEIDSILNEYKNQQSVKNGRFNGHNLSVFIDIDGTWAPRAWTFVGDFNGDGREDFASLSGNQALMKLGQGSPPDSYANFTSATWITNGVYGGAGYTFAGDFDGNGRSDIVSFDGGLAYVKLNMSDNNFSNRTLNVADSWGGSGYTFAGDFNGDGLDDIASLNGTDVYIKESSMSGGNFHFESRTESTNGQYGPSNYTFAGDFNNDGRDDIVSLDGPDVLIKVSESSGNFTNTSRAYVPLTLNNFLVPWGGDFVWQGDENGDGYDEFISAYAGSYLWQRQYLPSFSPLLYRNPTVGCHNCTGPVTATFNVWSSAGWEWMMDINGDGTDELITIINGRAYLH